MITFSAWHLLIPVWLLVFGWPTAKILQRMGFSGWWALLAFVPLGNIIGLWVVSVARWPVIDKP